MMNKNQFLRAVGIIGIVGVVIAQTYQGSMEWRHYIAALLAIVVLISPEAASKIR